MADVEKAIRRASELKGKDRRKGLRFSIQLKVRYSTRNVKQGVGTSVDISRNGILFTTQQVLEVGEYVVLRLEWPVYLDHKTPLQLALRGRVVRSSKNRAAVRFKKHEFRTLDLSGYLASARR